MRKQIDRMIYVAVGAGDISFLKRMSDWICWRTIYHRTPIASETVDAFAQELRQNWSAWEPLPSDPALWMDNHIKVWAGFSPARTRKSGINTSNSPVYTGKFELL